MPDSFSKNGLSQRLQAGLAESLGPTILSSLCDDPVIEVMVNPDQSIWIDHRHDGRIMIGEMDRDQIESVIRYVAACAKQTVNPRDASISAMLPDLFDDGHAGRFRFQGMLPPLVQAPSFAIRKLSPTTWSLDDYATSGIATPYQIAALREAIAGRKNILIAGGTGSGKTTLLNACLAEPSFRDERVFILEDTEELQFVGKDSVGMLTGKRVTLCDLLKSTLRMRPDRIIVGEVRGGEAHDMLKAWNTGHPGGICSLHANGACEALHRLQDLANEQAEVSPQKIVRAIDLVVFIRREESHPAQRVVQAVVQPTLDARGEFAVLTDPCQSRQSGSRDQSR